MPERQTLQRAQRDKLAGKAPSTQAGEFVREEMHHIREGRHGARSARQAVAIGLSKARRAGVALKPPAPRRSSEKTRRQAQRAYQRGQSGTGRAMNPRRRAAITEALEREPHESASPRALAAQARSAARRRSSASRSAAAQKAVRTKGPAARSLAAKKAARTRVTHGRSRSAGRIRMRSTRGRSATSARVGAAL
jgi:hypothetical protein